MRTLYSKLIVPAFDERINYLKSVKYEPDCKAPLRDLKEQVQAINSIAELVNQPWEPPSLDLIKSYFKVERYDNEIERQQVLLTESMDVDRQIEALVTAENERRAEARRKDKEAYEASYSDLRNFLRLKAEWQEKKWVESQDASILQLMPVEQLTLAEATEVLEAGAAEMPKTIKTPKFLQEASTNDFLATFLATLLIVLLCSPVIDFLFPIFFGCLIWMSVRFSKAARVSGLLYNVLVNYNVQEAPSYVNKKEHDPVTEDDLAEREDMAALLKKSDDLLKESQALVENEADSKLVTFDVERQALEEDYNKRIAEVDEIKKTALETLTGYKTSLESAIEQAIKNFKTLGNRECSELVYTNDIVTSYPNNEDVVVKCGNSNLCFSANDSVANTIRLLVLNAIEHVHIGQMVVHVYDPVGAGSAVISAITNESKLIQIAEDAQPARFVENVHRTWAASSTLLKGQDLDSYNKECAESGKLPATYHYYIVASGVDKLLEEEELLTYLAQGYKAGLYFALFFGKGESAMMKQVPRAMKLQCSFGDPECIELQPTEFAELMAVKEEMCLKGNKPKALLFDEFLQQYAYPMWSGNADKNIDVPLGYVNGDPFKIGVYKLGSEADVHALCAGGTGSGKSVLLNMIIESLAYMYSPQELQFVLADFKGTEFVTYINTPGTSNTLPHIKACLATADPNYAASLFKGVQAEAEERYNLLQNPATLSDRIPYKPEGYPIQDLRAFKDLNAWNKFWKKEAAEKEDPNFLLNVIPRIFMLVDEFQNILENADDLSKEAMLSAITYFGNVARAANITVLLSSQNLRKGLSDDIKAQFSLRICLRGDKSLSRDLLGADNAGEIKYSVGFLCAKKGTDSVDSIRLIKTPYTPDYKSPTDRGSLAPLIDKLSDAVPSIKGYQPIKMNAYLESTEHDISEVDEFFTKYADRIPEKGLVLLGPPMYYTDNKAPGNVLLRGRGKQNILSCFKEWDDITLFVRQVYTSLNHCKVPGVHMFHSAVDELWRYTCLSEEIPEQSKSLLGSDPIDVMSKIQKLYEKRAADTTTTEFKPAYFYLIGWDKAVGFAIDPDTSARRTFAGILQLCGAKNIHVIMVLTSMDTFPESLKDPFDIKIAGLCSLDDSKNMLRGRPIASKGSQLKKTGWIWMLLDGVYTKYKLYRSALKGKREEKTLVV